jgi:hypothetical protein
MKMSVCAFLMMVFLCSLGYAQNYSAQMSSDGTRFTVYATGFHQGGSKTFFEVDLQRAQVNLVTIPPTGVASDIMLPFTVSLALVTAPGEHVIVVHDKQGAHEVPINKAP